MAVLLNQSICRLSGRYRCRPPVRYRNRFCGARSASRVFGGSDVWRCHCQPSARPRSDGGGRIDAGHHVSAVHFAVRCFAQVAQATADGTFTSVLRCTPSNGSFQINGPALATAATQISWFVIV